MNKLLIATACLVVLGVKSANAQHDFKKVDAWMNAHTSEMGGRAILMVYQNGQMVYSHAVNQLNNQQKWCSVLWVTSRASQPT